MLETLLMEIVNLYTYFTKPIGMSKNLTTDRLHNFYHITSHHGVQTRAVESVHKSSDSDASIFKTSDSHSFIKAQYVFIMVNL
jgi:hypothetical protein